MNILAVDVAKDSLVVFDGKAVSQTENNRSDIRKLLRAREGWTVVMEPTGRYHYELLEQCVSLGLRVYLVNPRESRNYKDSMSFRAKTDALDARYLHDFIERNTDRLRAYVPPPKEVSELRLLLGKRQLLVKNRTALVSSFGKHLSDKEQAVVDATNEAIQDLEGQMHEIARQFEVYELLKSIPGVGNIVACALLYALKSRSFDSPESFIAFFGLDVRIRQSGKYRGLEKLTKRGDPVLRWLACSAGHSLLNSRFGKSKCQELKLKGRPHAARMAVAGRKILKTAFIIDSRNTLFDPSRWTWTST